MGFVTSQPGKGLYTLFVLTLNAIRLPFWIVYYIPPFFRQHKGYTHRQAVRVRIVRAFLEWASYVEMKTPLSLKPGRESTRFVIMPTAASKFFTATATIDPEIQPESIGGTWYPAEPKSKPEWVVLHFHGGAYAIGDGRDHDAGFAAKTIIQHSDATHVFAPQYRLGSNPKCRFPAQLQDAITSYVYLLETKGIDPSRIIMSGDSAGANLILSLLRYIANHGDKNRLPLPAVAWLWSPWLSPHAVMQGYTAEQQDNQNYWKDYITVEFGQWGAKGIVPSPSTGLSIASPEITFLDHPFATPVPLLVSIGECESLLPDQTTFVKQMQGVKGNIVEMQIEDNCVHDTILVGGLTGFHKEAAESVKKANKFLKQYAGKKGGAKI